MLGLSIETSTYADQYSATTIGTRYWPGDKEETTKSLA